MAPKRHCPAFRGSLCPSAPAIWALPSPTPTFCSRVGGDEVAIRFAAGATGDLVQGSGQNLVGARAVGLFLPAEAAKFAQHHQDGLASGRRAGPFRLKLAGGTDVDLSVFRLAENGENISCTISRIESAAPGADAATGLDSRDTFLPAAACLPPHYPAPPLANAGRLANENDAPDPGRCAGASWICVPAFPPKLADELLAAIGAGIGRSGASATGRLSETRFGALAAADVTLDLGGLVSIAIASAGLEPLATQESKFVLEGPGLSSEQRLLSLRYAVEKFAQSGQPPGDNADPGLCRPDAGNPEAPAGHDADREQERFSARLSAHRRSGDGQGLSL